MTFDGDREDTGVQLPAREAEILGLAAKGLTDRQIAAELGISKDTVSTYWRRILLRYKAANRTEVVARAVESHLTQKLNHAELISAHLRSEIHQHSEAQAKDLASRNLLAAVQGALVSFVSGSPAPQTIFEELLAELLAVTQSEFGLIAELATDKSGETSMRNWAITNIAWDKDSQNRYSNELTSKQLPLNEDGLFGAVAASPGAVVVNPEEADKWASAIPDGHPPLKSFLGIPIHSGSDVIGLVSIANCPSGYSAQTVEDLAPAAATCGAMIAGMRNDLRKREAEEAAAKHLARLDGILNTLDSAVILVDDDGIPQFANESFCNEFLPGLKPKEVIGKPSRELLEEFIGAFETPDQYRERINAVLSAAVPVTNELVRLKDGRAFLRDYYPLKRDNDYIGHVWKLRRH